MMVSVRRPSATYFLCLLTLSSALSCGGGSGTAPLNAHLYAVDQISSQISAFHLDATMGGLSPAGLPVSAGITPFAVAADPSGRFVYAADLSGVKVIGYATGGDGSLAPLVQQPPATGFQPIDIVLAGGYLYTANSNANNISAFGVDPQTGFLTEVSGSPFPTGTTPTTLVATSSARYLFSINQQSGDAWTYSTASGVLTPIAGGPVAVGNLPRGAALDHTGQYLYALTTTALGGPPSSSVVAFKVASDGSLSRIGSFPTGDFPWALAAHPSRPLLFVVNRMNPELWIYGIGSDGTLAEIAGSPFPLLTEPLSVAVTPSGDFLYVGHAGMVGIEAMRIDAMTGAPSVVTGSPFTNGIGGGNTLDIATAAKP